MTSERDLIHELVEAWNREGTDAMLPRLHPDCAVHTDPNWPDAGVYRGTEAIERFTRDFSDAWDSITLDERGIEQRGGRWLFDTRWVGTGRESGIDTDVAFTAVITFSDGLVSEMRLFFDRGKAIAAAEERV